MHQPSWLTSTQKIGAGDTDSWKRSSKGWCYLSHSSPLGLRADKGLHLAPLPPRSLTQGKNTLADSAIFVGGERSPTPAAPLMFPSPALCGALGRYNFWPQGFIVSQGETGIYDETFTNKFYFLNTFKIFTYIFFPSDFGAENISKLLMGR